MHAIVIEFASTENCYAFEFVKLCAMGSDAYKALQVSLSIWDRCKHTHNVDCGSYRRNENDTGTMNIVHCYM